MKNQDLNNTLQRIINLQHLMFQHPTTKSYHITQMKETWVICIIIELLYPVGLLLKFVIISAI